MYALCVGRGKDGCLTPSQRDNLLSSRRGLSASVIVRTIRNAARFRAITPPSDTYTAQHLSRENQAFAAGMPHDRIRNSFPGSHSFSKSPACLKQAPPASPQQKLIARIRQKLAYSFDFPIQIKIKDKALREPAPSGFRTQRITAGLIGGNCADSAPLQFHRGSGTGRKAQKYTQGSSSNIGFRIKKGCPPCEGSLFLRLRRGFCPKAHARP